jgi:hypothetical protein
MGWTASAVGGDFPEGFQLEKKGHIDAKSCGGLEVIDQAGTK